MVRREGHVPVSKGPSETSHEDYARRLETYELAWWKRFLNVQAPYQWNLRRLDPGLTLDLGCGIGRNLAALGTGSIGVDHNATSSQRLPEGGVLLHLPPKRNFERANITSVRRSTACSSRTCSSAHEDRRITVAHWRRVCRPGTSQAALILSPLRKRDSEAMPAMSHSPTSLPLVLFEATQAQVAASILVPFHG